MPEISYFRHEPDHILADKHGGLTTLANLAWACFSCNHFKGTDIASFAMLSQKIGPLFNPRTQQWKRHFKCNVHLIAPVTAAGRVTVTLLRLNSAEQIRDRLAFMASGHYS